MTVEEGLKRGEEKGRRKEGVKKVQKVKKDNKKKKRGRNKNCCSGLCAKTQKTGKKRNLLYLGEVLFKNENISSSMTGVKGILCEIGPTRVNGAEV